MHCKTCDYQLWNLRERRCPECGTPFRPSEFEFAQQTVQFCCPHCDQSYYGTGRDGRLVPPAFTCVGCDKPIDIDEMILLPAEGLEDEQTRVDVVPWLERGERGRARSWFSTIGLAMFNPARLMRAHPATNAPQEAWGFAIISNLLFVLTGIGPIVLLPLLFRFGFGMPLPRMSGGMLIGLGIAFVAAIVFTIIGIGIWGLVTHGILRLLSRPAGSIGRTYQALCYSAGANVTFAVPCLGLYLSFIGLIWWVVSAIIMVVQRQRVSGGRATLAVATFPVVVVVAIVGGYAALFSVAISRAGATTFPVTTSATTPTTMPATTPTTMPATMPNTMPTTMPIPPLGL